MGVPFAFQPLEYGKNLHLRQTQPYRHFIPCPAFQGSPGSFLLHATPLLEEKWDVGSQALIPNIHDPFL
jgi:hypothetical protein